jgi:N-acetylmuramoyl-L-alanine amidase
VACVAPAGMRSLARLLIPLCLAIMPASAAARQAGDPAPAALRIAGAAGAEVPGTVVGGVVAYPAATLERLGFSLVSSAAELTAVAGADTLRFWTTSPFIRRGSVVHQLATPVASVDGVIMLPEQLFIQWLPTAFPGRFEFRDGRLLLRDAATGPVPVAAAPSPATPLPAAGAPPRPGPPQGTEARTRPSPQSPAAEPRVVIIDPGHGGRDPGKVGPNGLREKDVTLAISQRLAAVLRDRGYEVHLTRTTDTLIALVDRPRLANKWRGDRQGAVFISIHANSAVSTAARGFETFFLSEARTEDERRVAQMENEAIRFEDTPSRPPAGGLDQVLGALRSDFLTRASHDLAAIMQDRMATFHPGPNRGVKRAGFYVLVGAVMPAVLVEAAFISHREEADLLGTQAFQQNLAWGIADGVDEFFRRNEHLWSNGR